MFKHDFTKIYSMVSVNERNLIIDKINSGEITSECTAGIKNKWWENKHHPDKEIPKNIYLLGDGTIQELHRQFREKTMMDIEWSEFINYTRELIKQGIML
jgi:hypothetical protein